MKKPITIIVILSAVLSAGAYIDWSYANTFFVLLLTGASLLTTIFIHELGHLILGLATGSRFLKFAAGPFVLERNDEGRLIFHLNAGWNEAGGYVLMQYEEPRFPQKVFLGSLGGPLFSLLTVPLYFNQMFYFELVGLFSIIFFVLTIIPYNFAGLFSDGYTMKQVLQKNQVFMYYYRMTNMLLSSKKPESWNVEIQREAADIHPDKLTVTELSIYLMFFFYSAIQTKDFTCLEKFYERIDLSQIKNGPISQKAIIMHYYAAAEYILNKPFSISFEEMEKLPPVDKLSKLRTSVIYQKNFNQLDSNGTSYLKHLRSKASSNYSFLQVEEKFCRQYIL
ncbi:site-2 protease family protein [Bacillus massiliglaciei]|uniref:site-2 protease family protein n=1 Tax=Bacillus massiliglaciei TaxID=1816693 RepID=UPI000DA619BA|nr:site-2 protease family protein [Bacillus massiliglaciei]